MPAYTLGEIMSLATARIGRRGEITASDASFYANTAYQEVAGVAPHALLEQSYNTSTLSGAATIALPSDFNEPLVFSISWPASWSTLSTANRSYQTLTPRSAYFFDSQGSLPSGTPQHYLLYNNRLEVHPSANSAYSFHARYRSYTEDLVSASSVPSLSTPWRYAVLLKTEQLLHEHVGNWPGAAAAENRYIAYCARTKTDEARRQSSQHPMGVHVVY